MSNKLIGWAMTFLLRGIIGMVSIYLINIFLGNQGYDIQVGMNLVTFLTSGTLGFPGVGLLYGVLLYQIL